MRSSSVSHCARLEYVSGPRMPARASERAVGGSRGGKRQDTTHKEACTGADTRRMDGRARRGGESARVRERAGSSRRAGQRRRPDALTGALGLVATDDGLCEAVVLVEGDHGLHDSCPRTEPKTRRGQGWGGGENGGGWGKGRVR